MFDKLLFRNVAPQMSHSVVVQMSRHDPNQTLRAAWNQAEAANFSGRLQLSEELLSYIG